MTFAENARLEFKCRSCGAMFPARDTAGTCPFCGNRCDASTCVTLESSDEGY